MEKLGIFIIVLFFTSCAMMQNILHQDKKNNVLASYKKMEDRDYLMHLSALGDHYLQTPGVKNLKLSKESLNYLTSIYMKLTLENELYYTKKIKPSFYIIESRTPFTFSLPNGKFFFSSELIHKYLKHEDILISVLSAEIFRVQYEIYGRKSVVSVGYIDTERLLSLLRLSEKNQTEIDKWAFYTMKRAGYDAIAYLSWLQIQNRNSMDFILQHGGDTQKISRQEFIFKKFIVEQGISNDDAQRFERRSSVDFYNFKKELTRVGYGSKNERE
ncbi:MAG: hypothetical protein A2202_04075 [Bdellovibrionales bacterium RIFOXYA1_FULL_36_14]|nr:MAG: hypothetical protein A2202_04075 [Bdellovibrionales bacterium RIFOXYA1_FULL_36_14]